jgi:hypothetical protein
LLNRAVYVAYVFLFVNKMNQQKSFF